MAQWQGQFLGHTHGTRIADLEEQLHHAVAAFRSTVDEAERKMLSRPVRRLARQLWSARLHDLKSKILHAQIGTQQGRSSAEDLGKLRARLAVIDSAGQEGVLAEFGWNEDRSGKTALAGADENPHHQPEPGVDPRRA